MKDRRIRVEDAVRIVRETADVSAEYAHLSARGALHIAAEALERGRHLSARERRENLQKALYGDIVDE